MLSFIDFFHFISTCNVKFTSKGWTKEVLIELLVNSGLLKISAKFTCSKSTMKTLEKCTEYIQSQK